MPYERRAANRAPRLSEWQKQERDREKAEKRKQRLADKERRKNEHITAERDRFERIRAKFPCHMPEDVVKVHLVPALVWLASDDGPASRNSYNDITEVRTEAMTFLNLIQMLIKTALVCQQWKITTYI